MAKKMCWFSLLIMMLGAMLPYGVLAWTEESYELTIYETSHQNFLKEFLSDPSFNIMSKNIFYEHRLVVSSSDKTVLDYYGGRQDDLEKLEGRTPSRRIGGVAFYSELVITLNSINGIEALLSDFGINGPVKEHAFIYYRPVPDGGTITLWVSTDSDNYYIVISTSYSGAITKENSIFEDPYIYTLYTSKDYYDKFAPKELKGHINGQAVYLEGAAQYYRGAILPFKRVIEAIGGEVTWINEGDLILRFRNGDEAYYISSKSSSIEVYRESDDSFVFFNNWPDFSYSIVDGVLYMNDRVLEVVLSLFNYRLEIDADNLEFYIYQDDKPQNGSGILFISP